MIPPILVRQIRPCEECIFFNTLEEFCTLHDEALYDERLERWEREDPTLPCPYHFTPDEIMELIEQNPGLEDKPLMNQKIWMAR
jgi:hypothetical protein